MRAGLAASTVTPGSTAPDVSLTTPETPAALVPCANMAVGVSKVPIATQTATPTLAIRVILRLLATVSGSDTQTGMRADGPGAESHSARAVLESGRCRRHRNSRPKRSRHVRRTGWIWIAVAIPCRLRLEALEPVAVEAKQPA